MSSENLLVTLEARIIRYALGEAAYQKFVHGKLPKSILLEASNRVTALSSRYVEGSGKREADLSEADAKSYALYYSLINAAKIDHLLGKLNRRTKETLQTVLDLGCGPGTASLVLLNHLPRLARLDLVDRSGAMRTCAEALVSDAIGSRRNSIKLQVSSAMPGKGEPAYDLAVLANVLNEIPRQSREKILRDVLQTLRPGAILLIIEPALREPTRELMSDRDWLLEKSAELQVLYPCTHRDACPMLRESEQDWCHGTLPWSGLRIVDQIDEVTGFNKHRLKFSALLLRKGAGSDRRRRSGEFRVVFGPITAGSTVRTTLCGSVNDEPGGLHAVTARRPTEKRIYKKAKLHSLVERTVALERGDDGEIEGEPATEVVAEDDRY